MHPLTGYLGYSGTWGYVWSGSLDYAKPPLVLYLFFGGDQTVSSANFSRYNAFPDGARIDAGNPCIKRGLGV